MSQGIPSGQRIPLPARRAQTPHGLVAPTVELAEVQIMPKVLYTIWVFIISSSNGELVDQYAGTTPYTLEQCNRALIEKGPIPAHDGKAVFAVCKKLEGKVRL